MRIAFVGNFTEKKGSQLFVELAQTVLKKDELFVFGHIGDRKYYLLIKDQITYYTKYETFELSELLINKKIDLVLILSIWAETYSMTFFESLFSGVPVISNDISFPYTKLYPEYDLFFGHREPVLSLKKVLNKFRSKPAHYKKLAEIITQKYRPIMAASAQLKYEILTENVNRL